MKSDPRRDPISRPPRRTTTGERVISARETLDSIAPLPSVPQESERISNPACMLEFMYELHASDRTVAAAIFGDLQEHGRQIEELKVDIDRLESGVIALEGRLTARLEKLEDSYRALANDQLYVRQETAKTNGKLDRLQQTHEEVWSGFDTRLKAVEQQRVPKLESRVDHLEGRSQQQYAELLRRLDHLEAGINGLKTNGGPPITPRAHSNYPGDPESKK